MNTRLPNLKLKALIKGDIVDMSLDSYIGRPLVLIFYPFNFSFVCPTELNEISAQKNKFLELDAEVLFVSCDSIYSHVTWSMIERQERGVRGVLWPMVSDYKRELCKALGLLEDEGNASRSTIITNKDGIIKYIAMNSQKIGRSVSEILRILNFVKYDDTNRIEELQRCNIKEEE